MNKEYIAGYFDGEGYIQIAKGGWLFCRVKASYKPVLAELQVQFGGSLYSEPRVNSHHKQLWVWEIRSNEAERFLREIEPFLREKGEQARIALTFQNGRNRDRSKGVHLTDANQEFLAHMRQELMCAKQQEFAS